jgi:P pilus assembly chaperone PapD
MLLCALLLAAIPGRLRVTPDAVHVTASAPRANLQLHNAGRKTAHVIVTTWSWWQSASGETRLDPSAEIDVQPSDVYLMPGATTTLQIQVTGPASEVERAFKVELEDEPLQAFGRAKPQAEHVSVPVFVAPDKAAPRPDVSGLEVEGGHARFTLVNSGTSHLPARLEVSLLGARGERLALKKLPDWTVLARAQVSYDVPLLSRWCLLAHSIQVEVGSGKDALRKVAPVTKEACAAQ